MIIWASMRKCKSTSTSRMRTLVLRRRSRVDDKICPATSIACEYASTISGDDVASSSSSTAWRERLCRCLTQRRDDEVVTVRNGEHQVRGCLIRQSACPEYRLDGPPVSLG